MTRLRGSAADNERATNFDVQFGCEIQICEAFNVLARAASHCSGCSAGGFALISGAGWRLCGVERRNIKPALDHMACGARSLSHAMSFKQAPINSLGQEIPGPHQDKMQSLL